ncbi:nucleotidyltransferase domain-containing protein [Actinoplanes couchii]|uniref:DNA polymerase beta domain protein region n=1 Tax=Actinoplanes couchii TaxID=403638 RepID=A0ABQ3XSX3_9ACTN|nr:nucleotidyltransferase domain-containing protein [Actinoplanes couchii]MDR6324092.1 hypothetical protein [Actinoplanes couchii]GID61618.1 hypothetical protein Aco03nite_100220 [Actinoplanes couchii]
MSDHTGGALPVVAALAASAQARRSWVTAAARVLSVDQRVRGVWLVGSLSHGRGDAFSDVDLIVVAGEPVPADLRDDPFAGLRMPGTVLYARRKPRNAPAGGGYLAVCLDMAGLPVLVDMYLWPVTTAVLPAGGNVLFHRGEVIRSTRGLLEVLAACPADDPAGADPTDPVSVFFLIQLAAKYHARADHSRYAGICRQLRIPADDFRALRLLLAGCSLSTEPGVTRAVERLLDVADEHRRLLEPASVSSSAKEGS